MTKHEEIAQWLYDRIMCEEYVTQVEAVYEIKARFGDEYVYVNENGNSAVDPKVYARFRKLKKGDIDWDRSDFSWHKVTGMERDSKKFLNVQIEDIQMTELSEVDLPDVDLSEIDTRIK